MIEEAIRCAICENPIKSERGCDGSCRYDEKLLNRIIEAVNGCIEADRPHGEWKYEPTKGAFCSECGCHSIWNFNFCPNCGADMREGEVE